MRGYLERHSRLVAYGLFVLAAPLGLGSKEFDRRAAATAAQTAAASTQHRFTKLTDSIYRADGVGLPGINSNSYVLINDDDVLFVDSEGSPASARSLIAGIKTITNKPIRYAVVR